MGNTVTPYNCISPINIATNQNHFLPTQTEFYPIYEYFYPLDNWLLCQLLVAVVVPEEWVEGINCVGQLH